MAAERGCVFCCIVEGTLPSSKILESDNLIAIPALDGGYPLIITKRHTVNWADPFLDDDTAKEIAVAQRRLVRVVMELNPEGGVTVLSTNGKAAGQEVDHLHVHIVPRTLDDKLIRLGKIPRFDKISLDGKAILYRSKLVELGLV